MYSSPACFSLLTFPPHLPCISLVSPALLPVSSPANQLLSCSPAPPAPHPLFTLVCIEVLVFSSVLLDPLFCSVLFCLHSDQDKDLFFKFLLPAVSCVWVHLLCSSQHTWRTGIFSLIETDISLKCVFCWQTADSPSLPDYIIHDTGSIRRRNIKIILFLVNDESCFMLPLLIRPTVKLLNRLRIRKQMKSKLGSDITPELVLLFVSISNWDVSDVISDQSDQLLRLITTDFQ